MSYLIVMRNIEGPTPNYFAKSVTYFSFDLLQGKM